MRLLVLLAVAAAALLLLVWFAQRKLIYFPSHDVPDPRELGLRDVEEARFTADDGVTLHGWFAPARPDASGRTRGLCVLVSHGNGGDVAHRAHLLRHLPPAGLHVLVYDYRGYGLSEGSPTEEGLYRDGRAARAWLLARTGLPPDRLVQFGESLGAAVSLELALDGPPPHAVVLQTPFTSLPGVAGELYPLLPVRLLLLDRFDNLGKVPRLTAPLLVLHGTQDSLVALSQGRALLERAGSATKRLVEVTGADHNEVWRDAKARCADVLAFLDGIDTPR